VTPVLVHPTGKYPSAEADFFKFLNWSKAAIEGSKTRKEYNLMHVIVSAY
jgi:hypothetical protein